jgi:hypothetical protein
MKGFLLTVVGTLFSPALVAQISTPPSGDNQRAKVSQFIGPVEVSIDYSSPDVLGSNGEDRRGHIWGELVHEGFIDQGFGSSKAAPWRAGANENTTISFSHNVSVSGKELRAGTYGLFLAYTKTGVSTWIFSKNSTSWGSYFYNENEDELRIDAIVQEAPYTEWLTFGFDDRKPNSTLTYLQWENKRFAFKIEVPNINDIYISKIRNELRSSPGFNSHNWSDASQFAAQNKINLEEAITWADNAMNPNFGGVENFVDLQTKATLLTAFGKEEEANQIIDKAIKLPGTSVFNIHQYGKSLLAAGKSQKALEVFQYNFKTHPEEKFTTYVGLARGYEAVGDKKNAIKNWEIAIKNVPDNQKAFLNVYQSELKKLKESQ